MKLYYTILTICLHVTCNSGPLRYKIEAHFTNAVGGLDAEFSYDEIGLLQVKHKLNIVLHLAYVLHFF